MTDNSGYIFLRDMMLVDWLGFLFLIFIEPQHRKGHEKASAADLFIDNADSCGKIMIFEPPQLDIFSPHASTGFFLMKFNLGAKLHSTLRV